MHETVSLIMCTVKVNISLEAFENKGDPILRAPGWLLFTVGPLKLLKVTTQQPIPSTQPMLTAGWMDEAEEALTLRFMYNLESECFLKCCLTLVLAPVTALSAHDGHLNLTGINLILTLPTTYYLNLIEMHKLHLFTKFGSYPCRWRVFEGIKGDYRSRATSLCPVKRDDVRFPGFDIFFVSFNKVNKARDETNPKPFFGVPLPKIDFSFSQHCK